MQIWLKYMKFDPFCDIFILSHVSNESLSRKIDQAAEKFHLTDAYFRMLSNSYDGAFLRKNCQSTIFSEKLHDRCLAGSWIRLFLPQNILRIFKWKPESILNDCSGFIDLKLIETEPIVFKKLISIVNRPRIYETK